MSKHIIVLHLSADEQEQATVQEMVDAFAQKCSPLEQTLYVLSDARTNARFVECHVPAGKLVELGTIDVPLDPEDQSEYRANRDILEDHVAFERMKADAHARRSFSNLVIEFTDVYDSDHPIKIIGGQHRFTAIQQALETGINELHGIKAYFNLDVDQRLDVQLISNTNIAVSNDLLDRMYETVVGPELRNWCQEVGLLLEGQDFADKRVRGQPITVRNARTFIMNYYLGREVDPKKFDQTKTVPVLVKTGGDAPEWNEVRKKHRDLWKDDKLKEAGESLHFLRRLNATTI